MEEAQEDSEAGQQAREGEAIKLHAQRKGVLNHRLDGKKPAMDYITD